MKITEVELIDFANDSKNNIEMGECDTNAIKVSIRFGCEIYSGEATYINSNGVHKDHPHIWNVLRFTSKSDQEVTQLIDIINYKENIGGKYIAHRNGDPISKGDLEKTRKMTRELLNA